ncbi:MAG TPA: CoA-transferase [Candidatus Dormibacteraeota bacterium]|nr:CoA-transferase [Candidatus Dormibacteraeota bacterium]
MFVSAGDAIAQLLPERTALVAVGGMHMHNHPMELVREIVRRRVGIDCLLTSPSASLAADLLIGAGLVRSVATSYIGFEHLGLAPAYRRAAESGGLEVFELCEAAIVHGLYAGAGGIPFVPLPPGLERSDVSSANQHHFRTVTDPFSGERRISVVGLRPDVALIHAAAADGDRNVFFAGAHFTDRLMAMAATKVIVQVERMAEPDEIAAHPAESVLPGFLVSAVVVAPGGCLPTASHGAYGYDEPALRAYMKLARTPEGFQEYLRGIDAAPVGAPA